MTEAPAVAIHTMQQVAERVRRQCNRAVVADRDEARQSVQHRLGAAESEGPRLVAQIDLERLVIERPDQSARLLVTRGILARGRGPLVDQRVDRRRARLVIWQRGRSGRVYASAYFLQSRVPGLLTLGDRFTLWVDLELPPFVPTTSLVAFSLVLFVSRRLLFSCSLHLALRISRP